MSTGGVYAIINTKNNWIYIGSFGKQGFLSRVNSHKRMLKRNCKVFKIREDARMYAFELYDEVMQDGPEGYGILEYGISDIKFDVPFPDLTDEQVNKILPGELDD